MQDQTALPPGTTILQVLPSLGTGGVERGALEITEAITRAGGRALVASAGGALSAQIRRAGGSLITLPLASKNPFTMRVNAGHLAAIILAERVAIVHARSRAPAWPAWWAASRTNTRFLTTYHGVYRENFPGKRAYNAVMTKGQLVIAVSHHVAAVIQSRTGLPADRIRVIHRGADLALFDPDLVSGERLAALAERWRLPPEAHPVILLPARLTRWKGAEVLIRALARMENRQAFAVLAGPEQGNGAFSRQLIALAHQLGVADRLRLVGNCDDMQAAYRIADVVAAPSLAPEPFGRTVVEAQAMGRIVIASHHGGATETIAHGVTGFLVAPNDPVMLAAALDHSLRLSPEQRDGFGRQARAAVAAHFTKQTMQNATLAVYRELLGLPPVKRAVKRRILIIRLGALGDVVLSFGAFAAIRAAHPQAHITLLTTAPFAGLAARAPWFDQVAIDRRPKLDDLPGILRLIRQLCGYDFVYDLQTSGRSSRYFFLAGAPDWSGIAPFCSHPHRAANRKLLHSIERQRDQLRAAGITEFPPAALDWLKSDIGRFALPPAFALLMPGAAPHRPEKRWPAEYFATLAIALNRRDLPAVIIGSAHESQIAAAIRQICPQARDLTGQTSIEDIASLAAHAALVVGNDTGPCHLAAAAGARCVALFGPASNPSLTAPRGNVTVIAAPDLAKLTPAEVLRVIFPA